MRVLFFTKYSRRGPSSRYRVLQFIPHLQSEGIECVVHPLHTDDYMDAIYSKRRKGAGYYAGRFIRRIGSIAALGGSSAVFIQKELVPYFPPLLEWYLHARKIKVIYDLDDAIHLNYSLSANRLVRFLLGKKIPKALGWSGVVLAGNRFLQSYASRFNPNTVRFPTVVDTLRYRPGERRDGEEGAGGVPLIGWIGTSETVVHLQYLENVLRRLAGERRFKLLVIGVPGTALEGIDVETVTWSEETEVYQLSRCSIGLMPHKPIEFVKGKCGLKLLQYMASGLPVVASPEGGGEDIIVDGENGFIARDDHQWLQRLKMLLDDPSLRRRFSEQGRNTVESRFSLEVWSSRMAGLIKKAVAGEWTGEEGW